MIVLNTAAVNATTTAINAATVASVVHKHVRHQEDEAKSCTTYQNLIFDATGSHTEPIIVCDTNIPPTCPEDDAAIGGVGTGVLFAVAAILGIIAGRFLGRKEH